jgi:nicotinate-nucleotide pyrophosphorylase (carboxylating)
VVEAKNPAEALDAAALHPDRILLDNFSPGAIADVLKRLHKDRPVRTLKGAPPAPVTGPEIEVSGGIRLSNVREFALPGVNYISVGAITHSAPAVDLSLLMDEGSPA